MIIPDPIRIESIQRSSINYAYELEKVEAERIPENEARAHHYFAFAKGHAFPLDQRTNDAGKVVCERCIRTHHCMGKAWLYAIGTYYGGEGGPIELVRWNNGRESL